MEYTARVTIDINFLIFIRTNIKIKVQGDRNALGKSVNGI